MFGLSQIAVILNCFELKNVDVFNCFESCLDTQKLLIKIELPTWCNQCLKLLQAFFVFVYTQILVWYFAQSFLKSTKTMMSKYYGTSFTEKCINVLNCIESCLDSHKLLLFLTVLNLKMLMYLTVLSLVWTLRNYW